MKRKSLPITNIGTVSLMMVFMVLCMVTFAALSLSSAAREARMGKQMAQRCTAYYNASNAAEELLAQADAACAYAYGKTSSPKKYYRLVSEKLDAGTFEMIWEDETLDAAYQVTVNDSQTLDVRLDFLSPAQTAENSAGTFYRILSWQVVNTDTVEEEPGLKLIK